VWEFDPDVIVIRHRIEGYEIDLATCVNSAEVLDWIAQLDGKTWVSSTDLGNLVRLMKDLLQCQPNFCGGGIDRPADPVAILEERLGHPPQRLRQAEEVANQPHHPPFRNAGVRLVPAAGRPVLRADGAAQPAPRR
jgi:hypothetical protein